MVNEPPTDVILYVRGALFDMDGVLVNSTGSDERCWLRWAQLHGMEGSFSLHSTHGRRAVDTIRALRPDLDPYVELRRLEDFDAEDPSGSSALPGATALLAALPARSWAIVTSAPVRLAKTRLQFAGIGLPHNFVTADDVFRGKPDPEPYELGARKLGLETSECLVIEDSPAGIKAGKAAGCKTLAVLSSHPIDALVEADWIVPSLDHVFAIPAHDGMIAIHCNSARCFP
jgi:mannitol-1-/sugar-/sorbitol-6-phosphatase